MAGAQIPASTPYGGWVVGPFLCSEKFISEYSSISLSLETCISKFQIDMERMETFKLFLKELLMESFARQAQRPKRSLARELNPTIEWLQALRGVVCYTPLGHLPSHSFLSCHTTLLSKRSVGLSEKKLAQL